MKILLVSAYPGSLSLNNIVTRNMCAMTVARHPGRKPAHALRVILNK